MKVSEFIEYGGYELLTKPDFEDREISGCYTGDLLSWVMGRAGSGDVWITVMNNINIAAVASLADTACILLAEGVSAADDVIKRADSQDIIILKSDKTGYELCVDYYKFSQND